MTPAPKLALVGLGAALTIVFSGCSAKSGEHADLVAGKQLFVQKCGSCHVLNRAGTKGTTGPNLDEAFRRDIQDGFGTSAVHGVVLKQIEIPNRMGVMPAKLVTGDDAEDVAAYVASVAAKSGKDGGLLATAVTPAGSSKPAVEKNGKLTIPADPTGQLLFENKTATGTAGEITVNMPNTSGVDHNIAIEGKGAGKIVAKGDSSFEANFAPGKYTYICEVPGHEAAGMKGTLTVK
ncbi:MAG TPA: c-type cytochrome [Solirubrobacteraceae bacterium]|nr:c-type cytochrome [Solirubrobacteraceae bacterium]